MSKKLYREEQAVRKFDLLAFSSLIAFMLFYVLGRELFIKSNTDMLTASVCLILLAIVSIGVYVALNLKFETTVSKKSIAFKLNHWHKQKHKIKVNDIESCEIIESPNLAAWHGDNISFSNETAFTFNGRNGVHLTTKNGDEYFIGSNNIKELKQALKKVLG